MDNIRIPKYNTFLHNAPLRKIPKSLVAYFTIIQLGFGFDTGITELSSAKFKSFAKHLTTLISVGFIVIFLSAMNQLYSEVWYLCIILRYVASVLVLRFNTYKIVKFLTDLHDFGGDIPAINRNITGTLVILIIFTIYICKYALVLYCVYEGISKYCGYIKNIYQYAMVNIGIQAVDTATGVIVINLYYLYCLIKEIKECLKLKKDLIHFEKRYVLLADLFEKIAPVHNSLIIIELCINTPRLMVTLWCMLLYIKENAEWYSYTSEWLFAFHLTIQMCIPAVIAEMVNSQMDAIKLILNEERRIEKDKGRSEELTRVLRYIKARHLQNDIWRVVPVDLRLPPGMLSLCTTYFIVILQFTHLYD